MINLEKGQNVKLEKSAQIVRIGLSWDASNNGHPVDLDAMALELKSKNGSALDEKHFVYYGHLQDSEGAVKHSGDNLTGEGDGDDEVITVDLSKLNPSVEAVVFLINIYQAASRGQNFGMVKNPKARLYYGSATTPDLVYELDEDFSTSTGLEFVMLYKNGDDWKFKAIGEGITGSTQDWLNKWGL